MIMKLLLVACLHGSVPKRLVSAVKKEKPDAMLCCGDLCDTDKLRRMAFGQWDLELLEAAFSSKKYESLLSEAAATMKVPLKFFRSLKMPVFLVYGNNDFPEKLGKSLPKNVMLLKSKVVKFGGIHIAGLSGYRHGGKHVSSLFRKIKQPAKTLLLTHDVPHGKFDLVKMRESPAYGRHVGEKLFNRQLKAKRLLAFACGHMHEHQGMEKLYGTPVINAGYGKVGKFAVVEIADNKIKKVKFFR